MVVRPPVISRIQRALTPDLLNPMWRKLVKPGDHPVTGHCYITAEALYHLWGKERGYRPYVITLGDAQTHWFLKNGRGDIADPSPEQFDGEAIPYERGRCSGFLTRHPSKRARVVMDRVDGYY